MEAGHDTVAIGGTFTSQVSTGVPVEIVEAENPQTVLQAERARQNVSADESMEIGEPAQLAGGVQMGSVSSGNDKPLSGMAEDGGLTGQLSSGAKTPSDQLSATGGLEVNVGVKTGQTQLQADSVSAQSAIEHFQQEVARSLGTSSRGLEVSADSIVFPQTPANVGTAGGPAPELVERAKRLLSANVSYGDLDISGAISDTSLDVSAMTSGHDVTGGGVVGLGGGGVGGLGGGILNEPGSPSSVESNFDSSELLNTEELHHDEMTSRLSQAGPIGVAAAAAIMTGRKRKRPHIFESNPALRKRHCSKLVRKLKETIIELSARVGLQAAVVFYRPARPDPKEDPSYKVFGASPLDTCLRNQKSAVCSEMEAVLHQQVPQQEKDTPAPTGPTLHDLPPLVFDGIPTPVHKMTQAQLRAFIPTMLKFSTGRGKPGWGKDEMKPAWWPAEIPWQNVRSDTRNEHKKKELSWTEGLRRIVINCYLHHARLDLLPEFSAEQLQHTISPEAAHQIQMQLERLQQQQQQQQQGEGGVTGVGMGGEEGGGAGGDAHSVSVGVGLSEVGTTTQELVGGVSDSQQVFTVDTGIGNCDTVGMPTLADATLAEAAAKLQQVADETGEVQYATQTVTVTERDAKALGQPVGSTTTVLLTAYPGGHSSGLESTSDTSQHFLTPPSTTANVPNVQVVYSASHIDSIPDALVSSISSSIPQTYNTSASSSSVMSSLDPSAMVVAQGGAAGIQVSTEYLNPTAGSSVLLGGGATSVEPANNAQTASEANVSDIAAQLINEYVTGNPGVPVFSTPSNNQADSVFSAASNNPSEPVFPAPTNTPAVPAFSAQTSNTVLSTFSGANTTPGESVFSAQTNNNIVVPDFSTHSTNQAEPIFSAPSNTPVEPVLAAPNNNPVQSVFPASVANPVESVFSNSGNTASVPVFPTPTNNQLESAISTAGNATAGNVFSTLSSAPTEPEIESMQTDTLPVTTTNNAAANIVSS